MLSKEQIEELVKGLDNCVECNVYQTIIIYMKKLLESQIKVGENSIRYLDGRELFKGLMTCLELHLKEMEKRKEQK